jgi:hypothetical protein
MIAFFVTSRVTVSFGYIRRLSHSQLDGYTFPVFNSFYCSLLCLLWALALATSEVGLPPDLDSAAAQAKCECSIRPILTATKASVVHVRLSARAGSEHLPSHSGYSSISHFEQLHVATSMCWYNAVQQLLLANRNLFSALYYLLHASSKVELHTRKLHNCAQHVERHKPNLHSSTQQYDLVL